MDYTIGSGSLNTREVEELRNELPPTHRGRTHIPSAHFTAKRDAAAAAAVASSGATARDASAGSRADAEIDAAAVNENITTMMAAPRYKFHVN